jgi:RHS repeat-associated protein
MSISGTGVPPGSTITSVDLNASQITISNAATATNADVALTITPAPTDNVRVTPVAGAVFVIGTGWGGTGRGMIEKHRKLLQRNAAAQSPPNPNAESVLGEGLAMIGYTWLAEFTHVQQRVAEITGVLTTYPHAVGIIGMKPVGTSQGPYVDLPINILTTVQRANHPPPSAAAPTPAESAAFFVDSGVSSVLESGSIEQTQPNATAASTVKLLDLWSQSGAIFDINDPEIAGDDCSYYKQTIRPLMTGYAAADRARIDSLVGYDAGTSACGSSTTRVIAPSNGTLTVGQWTGTGYIEVLYDPTRTVVSGVGNIITGGLSGGEPASPVPPTQVGDNQAGAQSGSQYVPPSQSAPSIASTTNTNIAAAGGGSSATQQKGGDPVDLVTGSYVYNHQDLSVGSGSYPDTLPFVRYFDSALAQSGRNSSLLGNGWMHSYDLTALPDSDGFEGMGDNSPVSGAASIAALYVLQDILNKVTSTAKPTDRVIIASQIELWLMQQMTNNVVSVTRPGSIERFVLLPDGSYNPPIGTAGALTGSAGAGYTYKSAGGETLGFNATAATAAGKIVGWSNAAGAAVAFAYNGSGQLQSVCEPSCAAPARQLSLHYQSNRLTAVDDATGSAPRTVGYTYDSRNDLTGVTDPLGFATSFAYDGAGQLTQIFYPAAPAHAFGTMSYDSLGRPEQQADAVGNVTTLRFAGSRTEIDDPGGTARVSYFTPRGRTLATIEGLGSAEISGGAGNLTSYSYDGLDRILGVTDPELGSRSYTYDAYSNPLSIISTPKPGSGLAPVARYLSYVSPIPAQPNFEAVASAIDPLGLVTAYGYDRRGNRVAMVADAGGGAHFNATSRFSYDAQGRMLTAADPLGTVTQYRYDGLGNLASVVADAGGLNQTTLHSYDAVGNLAATTDPNGNVTSNSWDADRRLVEVAAPPAPFSLVTLYSRDPNGNLVETRQSAGGQVLRTTTASYTPAGKLATATDANGNVTRYAYDANGRLAQVTDPSGNATVYGYDALGRPATIANPAIQASPLTRRSWTPDGLLASLSIARSNTLADTTSYTYDGFDRRLRTAFPDGSGETLGYDADGNVLTRKTRRGDTIAFTYDTLNRLQTKAAPGEATVTYGWDLAGRMTRAGDFSAAITVPTTTASYRTTTSWDAINRPLAVSWSPAATQTAPAASAVTFRHGYDATNRRISQTATDKSWWSYPANPTTTTIGYAANNLNQYTTIGAAHPTYDANGNPTFDGVFTYGYDAESRLTSVKQGATTIASYAWDAQGRRKSKTVGSTKTVYVTDADNREVLEYDGTTGAVQRWYAFGQGPDEALGQMNIAAGTRTTLIPDIQGSIIATLDSSGTLTRIGYQPYGENPTLTSGTYRYTARRFDGETAGSAAQPSGLYYYRARMYSPSWGRFLQPDPLGYAGGANLYAYVNNDPLNHTDPSGLDTWSFGLNASGFFGGGGSLTIGFYYNTDTGRFGTFQTLGGGGGIDISANLVLQNTFGGPENFFGSQFGSAFAGARGPVGGGPIYGPEFKPSRLSTYRAPSGFQVSVGTSGIQKLTGIPLAAGVQQSTTYETTGAVAAALAAASGDVMTANQIGPAAPIPGVPNRFLLGPSGIATGSGAEK